MNRTVLKAREGYVYTNGKEYGKIIYLAVGVSPYGYYEITEEQYKQLLEKENQL